MKKIISVLLILFLVPVMVIADEYDDAYTAGKAAGNLIRTEINTGEKINQKISVPMTDETAPLKTFGPESEQKSMHIEITSQSSNEFLNIIASASSRGDIRNMIVEMDTDFDGVLDATYVVPYKISGVCANGFISCFTGTWSGCKYYQWRFSKSGGIRAVPVSTQDELTGCYCINSSCNSTITFDDMPLVLKDLGGAIVGAVQSHSSNYTITHVSETQNSIKYFGQNSGAIKTNHDTYFSGESNPESMYNPKNDAALKAQTVTHTNRQSREADSYYTNLSSSYEAIDQPVSEKSCIIRRIIDFQNTTTGTTPPVVTTSNSCTGSDFTGCKLKEEFICDYSGVNCVQTFKNFNPTQKKPVTYCEQMAPYIFCNDGTTIKEVGLGVIYAGPETWFYTRRVYQCQEKNQDYSADSELQRTGHVTDTVDLSGNMVTYEDIDPDTGAVVQQDFQYPDTEEFSDCELACKILRPVDDTNVLQEGTVSDYKKTKESFEYIVEPCDNNGACPVKPGDSIVTDCSCISSFSEMVSIMQGLKEASDDMVCSKE